MAVMFTERVLTDHALSGIAAANLEMYLRMLRACDEAGRVSKDDFDADILWSAGDGADMIEMFNRGLVEPDESGYLSLPFADRHRVTTESRKARHAAYMREYRKRKKAEAGK